MEPAQNKDQASRNRDTLAPTHAGRSQCSLNICQRGNREQNGSGDGQRVNPEQRAENYQQRPDRQAGLLLPSEPGTALDAEQIRRSAQNGEEQTGHDDQRTHPRTRPDVTRTATEMEFVGCVRAHVAEMEVNRSAVNVPGDNVNTRRRAAPLAAQALVILL